VVVVGVVLTMMMSMMMTTMIHHRMPYLPGTLVCDPSCSYDTVHFKCRYVRLPDGYVISSLSWGTGSCFFVVSVQCLSKANAAAVAEAVDLRSGILIYCFEHWHPAWHSDKVRAPHFLLHTGLQIPDDDAMEGMTQDEWKDRFLVCPENYPLSSGPLLPPPPLIDDKPLFDKPLLVVQAQLEPCSCRLFVAFAEQHVIKEGKTKIKTKIHIAA
jgi:hypothetical protein